MDIQYVFGNPVRGKRKRQAKRPGTGMRKAKRRVLSRLKTKARKIGQPLSRTFMPRLERLEKRAKYQDRKSALLEAFGAKKSIRAKASKLAKKLKSRVKKSRSALARLETLAVRRKKALLAKTKKRSKGGDTEMAKKKKKAKKVSRKVRKSASKRKRVSKVRRRKPMKARKVSRRRKRKALVAANPARRRRRVRRMKGRVRARRSLRRSNPLKSLLGGKNMIQSLLAHSAGEAGGLLLGGALYGAAGSLIGKIPVVGPKVVDTLRKVPVVGPSLPTLLAGVVLVKLGERQKIDALKMVGKGLIGATVVGIGVQASQKIPGLAPAAALKGVDFTALDGVDFTSLGSDVDAADFGGDGQMGEIAYGELPEGLSGVDFTMGLDDGADFGELPEGLGEGQMG